uniref:Uncharacterized protein n=1 Tax=Cyanistes caeruleus TaxID=156563 RepID=A0A8C0VSA3_CYACU
ICPDPLWGAQPLQLHRRASQPCPSRATPEGSSHPTATPQPPQSTFPAVQGFSQHEKTKENNVQCLLGKWK